MTRLAVLPALTILLAAPAAQATVVPAPGYAVRTIATPGTVQGGVVRRGAAVLVGQGAFGVGGEQVIRLDAAGVTTVAIGFNSLGGFDLDAGGTLYVVDNGGDLAGAATGDTLYALPGALTATTAVAAAGHEVVPAGAIPFAMHPLVVAGGDVLVTDAAGFGGGRVVRVTPGAPATLATVLTGLDFLGGLALDGTGTLLVGNVVFDPLTFASTGAILRYSLAGAPLGTLAGGLSGALAHVVDSDGNVLVSGGFDPGSGTGTVIAIAPGGAVHERAHGFGFAGEMFFDAARDETLVLDFGASAITAVCRDQDGDGVCDADDECVGAAIGKPKLVINKLATPPGDETLALAGTVSLPFPFAPALDPVATGLHVLVAGAGGPVLDVAIPPGAYDAVTKTGWRTKVDKFKFVNSSGGLGGIVAAAVKPSRKFPGVVKLAVASRKGTYTVGPADLPLRATLILDAAAGQCGDATFPGLARVCVHDPAKGKVTCH